MTVLLSAVAASLAAALIVGPWHRPVPTSRRASRRFALRVVTRRLDERAVRVTVGLTAGTAGFSAGGLLVAAASVLAAVALTRAFQTRRAERHAAQRRATTEALLDALSAELSSGAAPSEAVGAVLPDLPPAVRIELDSVRHALRAGGDAAAAWREVLSITQTDALAAAFQVCEDTGASLAAALSRLAAMAADERRRRDEIGMALAGPRSSAALLSALPVLGVLAGAGSGAAPLPFLLRTPAGHLCLFLGVALDVLGAAWVARLAASAGRPSSLP